ncbi:MAG TPA: tyrosine-type recombinase/integrase [Acidiferrobacter sp.]|nr:tyrosine-type recombinase/integrase [Acidiferrobacter sp.]
MAGFIRERQAEGVGANAIRPDSISQAFERVCRLASSGKAAGIEGLTFRDLRHEAASRLFEKGLNQVEAATVTGHKTLQMLKRYTHTWPPPVCQAPHFTMSRRCGMQPCIRTFDEAYASVPDGLR